MLSEQSGVFQQIGGFGFGLQLGLELGGSIHILCLSTSSSFDSLVLGFALTSPDLQKVLKFCFPKTGNFFNSSQN